MPITVQMFDRIAESRGIRAALDVAEEAGGVTGTRELIASGIHEPAPATVTSTPASVGSTVTPRPGPADMSPTYIPTTSPTAMATSGGSFPISSPIHAYWGPGSPYAGGYIGLVSPTDAASLTNANYEVRPGPPDLGTAGTTVTPVESPGAQTLTGEQSRWNSTYGAPGSQKAMDFFLEAYPSDEFSRITEAFKTYYSKEYEARLAADKGDTTTAAATTVTPTSAILKSLNAGNVIRLSELAKIPDPATRTRAAAFLANNIVTSLGSTQDAASALGSLYNEYFDTPEGFGGWAESLGFKWDELEKPVEPVGGTAATSTAVYDSVGNMQMVPDDLLTNFLRDNPTFTLTPPSEETILGEGGVSIMDPSAGETMLGQGTLETAIGDAQKITPAAMLNEIIEGLIAGSQTGVTPSNDDVIQQIMDALGYSQSDASTIFFSTVKPEWQSGITTATPVPAATAVPVPVPELAPTVATQNIPREELFAAQGREDLQRRLLAGTFGTGLSPTGGRAARNIYNRFASQLPIMEFGQGAQLPGPAFASFLANQPDPAALTAGLEAIQAGGAGNVFFEEAFPDVESVVGAGMQPFLMGLNPRLRSGIGNILRERALTAAAQAPETVVTPEDRMALLGNIMQFQPPASGFQGSNPTAFNWNQPASATGQWT